MKYDTTYDRVPYESQSFPQSHPERLATVGLLFGMAPALPEKCRVLELGCGTGANLIPMAFHLPDSELVGIDLAGQRVEEGREMIQALKLENIRLEHGSILDVDTSWGLFDYIICHGVYSWVAPDIQEKILSIASENLEKDGIAYVSYNTYPGWHIREMVRNMMLFHANRFEDTKERVEQAVALMDFLTESVPAADDHYGMLLQNELDLIKKCKDWYLYHDHLADVNAPVYFNQFIERAEEHDLQYLGEADFSAMLANWMPEKVRDTLRRISDNIIHDEQYMDFVRNRFFRQTLLCHKKLTLNRNVKSDELDRFLVSSCAYPENKLVNLAPGKKETFIMPGGLTINTYNPLTKAGLLVLNESWPRALPFKDLLKAAENRLAEIQTDIIKDDGGFAKDMLYCYASNIVTFHTWQAGFICEVTKRPEASELARYQSLHDSKVINQRHEVIKLDSMTHQLIRLLDGARDHGDLLKCMMDITKEGTLVIRENGTKIEDEQKLKETLARALDHALLKMAGVAFLVS